MAWNEAALDPLGLGNMKELEELMTVCYMETLFFAKTFFPKAFWRPWSPLHHQIAKILDDNSIQQGAIAAPRGIGKTSLISLAFPAKRILFKDSTHVIPVSATADSAIEQADNLKAQFVENDLIKILFGELAPEDRSDPFGMKEWVLRNGTKVRPRGAEQQIRGRQYRFQRPDLFLFDDMEDDESVESEERRDKRKRWFFSAAVNSVDRGSNTWRIIINGTILHPMSLLNELMTDPDWTSVKLELCDDNYKSNWPEYMGDEKIKALADSYRSKGLLSVFYREFRNIPIAKEEQGFKEEYFHPYTESEPELTLNPDIETIILADPARTMKDGSAQTAVAVVSINKKTEELYIRDIVEERMSPSGLIDCMFDQAEKFNALVLAPEVTGLNEYIMWPIRNEMLRRRRGYVIVEVKPREGKTGPHRSAGLIPLYRQGLIKHNPIACGGLERYLLQWPRPDRWDVIDAVSGVIFVMDEGERFLGLESAETPAEIEAEYKELNSFDDDELVPIHSKTSLY